MFWPSGENGDERGEEGGFERGADERWEGRGVGRLPAMRCEGVSALDTGERWVTYVQQDPTGGGI